jgi:predicted nucleic acid-binding protein
MGTLLLDTGPLVALLSQDDRYHTWIREVLAEEHEPLLTCEAVLSEACFLLRRNGNDPELALRLVERGVVRLAFDLAAEFANVHALFTRYRNVPASLADACLVRMSELHPGARVVTLDADFLIYRKSRGRAVQVLTPMEQ